MTVTANSVKPVHIREPFGATPIYSVPDDRHVPDGAETIGMLVRRARRENAEERQLTREQREALKRLEWHQTLYRRWCKMALVDKNKLFPKGHPIHGDIIVWEMYVCRFLFDAAAPGVEQWFRVDVDEQGRRELCDLSRTTRRRINSAAKDFSEAVED